MVRFIMITLIHSSCKLIGNLIALLSGSNKINMLLINMMTKTNIERQMEINNESNSLKAFNSVPLRKPE